MRRRNPGRAGETCPAPALPASAYRQTEHTFAGMQKGAVSPFLCHPQRRTVEEPLGGGLEGRSPPTVIRTRRHARRVRKPCAARFSRIDKWNTLLRGCRKGRQAPSFAIRSGGVYAARSGCKPLPLSCSGRALRAQEHDVPLRCKAAPNLAAKDCPQSNRKRRHIVSPDMDSGSDLVFRAVSSQVPSARRGLTSVFGMGTGGTLLPLPPERICSFPAP